MGVRVGARQSEVKVRAEVKKLEVGLPRARARVGLGIGIGLSDAVITLSTAFVRMDNLRKTQKKKTVVRLKLHARVK